MKPVRLALAAAVALPILALAGLVWYQERQLARGTPVVLDIQGYDPRDLLAGHYLRYRVDWGVEPCLGQPDQPVWICLRPRPGAAFNGPPPGCRLSVHARCRNGRVEAGIERYYVPESQAADLDRRLRAQGMRLEIAVTPDGRAAVRRLLPAPAKPPPP